MSTWIFLLLLTREISLIHYCNSKIDLFFHVQLKSILINNISEYSIIDNNHHFIGQILYRYDQIQLGYECQMKQSQ